MRIILPLLLVTAATVVFVAPSAGACHVGDVSPLEAMALGHRIVVDADYGGCPHELTLCAQVWRGPTLIALVCPFP